jgi:hypothetical protein
LADLSANESTPQWSIDILSCLSVDRFGRVLCFNGELPVDVAGLEGETIG